MKYSTAIVIVLIVISALSGVNSRPETTTARNAPQFGETIKHLTSQLMEINATSPDILTLDTRTPPKIKQHTKNKVTETFENSHAGVAIPIDADEIQLEDDTMKKLNFYKVDRPTTNSGLSTWILLSGQTASTTKKPEAKPQNTTLIVEPNKNIKPIFKKRVTTTRKPFSPKTTTQATTTPKATTKLNKVKASVLNSAVSKKTRTTTDASVKVNDVTTKDEVTTESVSINNVTLTNSTSSLPVEAKDGETDLVVEADDKKTKRPTNKRKKNKNRRRRPVEKSDNSTKIVKHNKKEKPIGTQLYNYLSREVMPTVGVGLVGLVVTAGLASYFLYPFGIAKRSYEVDRRDKEGSYYYNDEYSGGIAEEEAIGKVIAGMPVNSLHGNSYKTPTSRNSFPTVGNRQVDRVPQENIQYNPSNYDYHPVSYDKDVIEGNKENNVEQKFVVGSVPQEEVTPVVVPEHGPRSLKFRKKREVTNELDNEIESNFEATTNEAAATIEVASTVDPVTFTEPSTSTTVRPDKFTSFMHMMKELLHLKVNLGLQLLQNATQAVSKYVSNVQRRLDEHYSNYTMSRH